MQLSRPILKLLPFAIALACGCRDPKDKSDAAGTQELSPTAKRANQPDTLADAKPNTVSGAATDATPALADRAVRCADPCLLLTEVDLVNDPEATYQTLCAANGLGKATFDKVSAWSPFEDGAEPIVGPTSDNSPCTAFDVARNCIFAAYGNVFKRDRWKRQFANRPWYRPNQAFATSMLSPTAKANIAWLILQKNSCVAGEDAGIPPATRRAVLAWFAARNKGDVTLLRIGNDPIFEGDWKDSSLFRLKAWHTLAHITYADIDSAAPLPKGKEYEYVAVATGMPDPKLPCEGEDCEGFETIYFAIKGGQLAAVSYTYSACPFVYEYTARGKLFYQGELLRNLRSPALEATQALELTASPNQPSMECSSVRRFLISEEKAETTQLDMLVLRLDGQLVLPHECIADPHAAICRDDGKMVVLRPGETREVWFSLDAPSCGPGKIIANGYYDQLSKP